MYDVDSVHSGIGCLDVCPVEQLRATLRRATLDVVIRHGHAEMQSQMCKTSGSDNLNDLQPRGKKRHRSQWQHRYVIEYHKANGEAVTTAASIQQHTSIHNNNRVQPPTCKAPTLVHAQSPTQTLDLRQSCGNKSHTQKQHPTLKPRSCWRTTSQLRCG